MGKILEELKKRAGDKCELCSSDNQLSHYEIPSSPEVSIDTSILICATCKDQINNPDTMDENHWRCLNDSMWSEVLPVQIMSYRVLKTFTSASFTADLLEQIYLDEDALVWAEAGIQEASNSSKPCKDSNGAKLEDGDSVTLIKDLVVKGANFTAKRGTMVKNISLTDNPEHIEGKVSGTRIVLLTCFLKKV